MHGDNYRRAFSEKKEAASYSAVFTIPSLLRTTCLAGIDEHNRYKYVRQAYRLRRNTDCAWYQSFSVWEAFAML